MGVPKVILPHPLTSFVCIVLICGVSIVILNFHTTNIVQEFTTVFIGVKRDLLTIRDTTRPSPLQTIETTTFPSDILHEWNENDKRALAIFILSAIGFNTKRTRNGYQADIKLSGWVAKKHQNVAVKCCILLNSGVTLNFPEITTQNITTPTARTLKLGLKAQQYQCHLNRHIDNVQGVTLQWKRLRCRKNKDNYIKPFIPKKVYTEESFAICLKIVYEQVNNANLKDWLDYNRAIGVDKVFMYTYNISRTTSKILRHYIKLGYVETRPFAYPWNHTRHVGEKINTVWEDERVVMSDCLQRLSTYKYLAVVDLDEYIVPRKYENIKSVMKHLMESYPDAGGFQLHSYIFDKNVGPDPNTPANLPEFMRYFNRTIGLVGRKTRSKHIVLPTRITVQGYATHQFTTRPEYQKVIANTSDVALNHYRHCYEDLKEACARLQTDTYMLKFYKILSNNTDYKNLR